VQGYQKFEVDGLEIREKARFSSVIKLLPKPEHMVVPGLGKPFSEVF
jgi:hypothetical protein